MNLQNVQTTFSRPTAIGTHKGNGDFWLYVITITAVGYVGYRIYQEIKREEREIRVK